MRKAIFIVSLFTSALTNYAQNIAYSYDKTNRLTESRTGCSIIKYSYDENGNRKQSNSIRINVDTTITDVSCSGDGSDGKIILIPSGNTNYTYAWNTGQITSSISNLLPGEYFVTITDIQEDFSCVKSFKVHPPIKNDSIIVVPKNESCFAYNDGKARIDVVKPDPLALYRYKWDTTVSTLFSSVDSIGGLSIGNYIASIKNITNGCIQHIPFTITGPQKSILSIETNDIRCANGHEGSIKINMREDSSRYLYSWTGPNSFVRKEQNISSLIGGEYFVSVKENFGNSCIVSDSAKINIIRPNEILNIKTSSPTCDNPFLGTAEAIVLSAVGNYSYEWFSKDANQSVVSNSNSVLLKPGNYQLTVTENALNGCTDTAEFKIDETLLTPDRINVYPNPTNGILTIKGCSNRLIYYTLIDILGRKIQQGKFERLPAQINLLKFPKSEYLIRLYLNEKDKKAFKILKIIKQ